MGWWWISVLSLAWLGVELNKADPVIQMRKPTKKRDMNVFHDICLTDNGGTLVDWMFQYASLHGLARNKRMTGKFDKAIFDKLKQVFTFPVKLLDIVDAEKCKNYLVVVDRKHCTFDRGFVQYIEGTDHVVLPDAHLNSWFYFYNSVRKVREEFTIVDSLNKEAKEVLDAGLQHAIKSKHVKNAEKVTFIGIYVNRIESGIDYEGKNHVVPTASYYRSAMDFYEGNYENIVYMVYATDIKWAKANLQGGPFVYVESEVEELLLAIMANCKHMILSPGSFGFWSAYLSNGETIYYKRKDESENTRHYSYHKMDYYLPYWRPME